jgi:hypothetical protein
MVPRAATVLALAALLAGCGNFPPSPAEVAQNYVDAIAGGDYASACSLLDVRSRNALKLWMRSQGGCPALLARCLPTNPSVLQHDQAQLFYANVASTVYGSAASVRVSGTAVADRIREVTLVKQGDHWILTSYGKQRCSPGHGRRRSK